MTPDLMYVFVPQATNSVNAPSSQKVQVLERNFFDPRSSPHRILKGSTTRPNWRNVIPCKFSDLTGGEI